MSTAQVASPETPRLSEPQRIVNTFVAPSKTFTDIRQNASWWVPWLLLSIFSLMFGYAVNSKITWDRVVENEIQKNSRAVAQMEKLTPEQRQQQIDLQVKISKYVSYAYPVFVLIFIAVEAAVLMATFNFGLGARVGFGTSMAIVAYSFLVTLVSTLLAIGTMFLGVDPEGFNIRNPVATNPAYFMDPTQHQALYSLVSMFDVIAIWMIVLIGIGFARNSKVKTGTAIAVVAGWYIFIKLVGAGFAALF